MNPLKNSVSGRMLWLTGTAAAAAAAGALRRWQLSSAFEKDTGLPVRGAQASVTLICVLVIAAAGFVILSVYRPLAPKPWTLGEASRWDQVFLDTGDPVFPILEVAAAFFAILSVPVLFIVGVGQFELYQEMLKAHLQTPTNNGLLTLATAAGAFLAALGLLQTGRDGLRPGRRGKGGFSAVLPGVAGCIWLMETFRAHAANPVLWDYAPQLLAIMLGMGFYMEFAGMSAGAARPRRLLWTACMTVILSVVAVVSGLAELSARSAMGLSLCSAQLGDLFLLISQTLAAAGVLWRLPPSLEARPEPNGSAPAHPGPTQEIEEETTHE